MKKIRIDWGFLRRAFGLSVLAVFLGPVLHAQEIHIRVLDAHNGKPITNECLNVSIGSWHGADLVAPTNKDGIVVLHFENGRVTAENISPSVCSRTAVLGPKPIPEKLETITLGSDYYVDCQEYGKFRSGERPTPEALRQLVPSYAISKILESGISAGNTCGKFKAEAKPGEVILFVRPRSFLQRLRQ